MWRKTPLKDQYDVVIIGAGVHGLSIAYYLSKRGITNVAVLDKSYIGSGNSGRNTQIIRSNYRTSPSVRFYDESLRLYEGLSQDLDYNLLIDKPGLLSIAHTDFALEGLMLRTEINQALGVESRMVDLKEIKELVPLINLDPDSRYPILGGFYHPRGGVIRHDAVIWGIANGAYQRGVEIHPHTEVTSIMTEDHHVTGVLANGREIKCNYVVNATAGWCSTIAQMVDLKLPIVTTPLQACVTEPLKPFMNMVIMSVNLSAYFYQTARGEVVMGAEIDPYSSYSQRSTLPTLEAMCTAVLQIIPCLANVNVLRQWAGICDMTPDFSPIMGKAPGIEGFILDIGWGTYGFKTGPGAGKEIAELIATGKTPEIIKPFSLERFYENNPLDEKAAAGTAH